MKIKWIRWIENSVIFDDGYYSGTTIPSRSYNVVHYLVWGWQNYLNPHPLFDAAYYVYNNPDVRDSGIQPLAHYIRHGSFEGRNPHPYFDTKYYLDTNPDVRADGINPLEHFIKHGFRESRDPSAAISIASYRRSFPDFLPITRDIERLIEWHTSVLRTREAGLGVYNAPPLVTDTSINLDDLPDELPEVAVQCVYGPKHVRHIREVLIPSLLDATKFKVKLYLLNYLPSGEPISLAGEDGRLDIINVRPDAHVGFAEGHNVIFSRANHPEFFFLLNPDCIPQKGSIDVLISRFLSTGGKAGIVEGRQWPFEHPKEYNPRNLETPWASGAFALINAEMYREAGGMDPRYFLYLEDVDLSWQSWSLNYPVLYEPNAAVIHFTGGHFYRDDLTEPEKFYSLRNFIIISRKFFGEAGERRALAYLANFPDAALAALAIEDYRNKCDNEFVVWPHEDRPHPMIKILGLNQFHEFRQ